MNLSTVAKKVEARESFKEDFGHEEYLAAKRLAEKAGYKVVQGAWMGTECTLDFQAPSNEPKERTVFDAERERVMTGKGDGPV